MANIDFKCENNHKGYAPAHVTVARCPQAQCNASVKRVGPGSRLPSTRKVAK